MTTFAQIETSTQSARPIELLTLVTPLVTYHVTTAESDQVFGGVTYSAVASSRGSIQIVDLLTDQSGFEFEIPATHALAQQFVNGVPPGSLQVTQVRVYQAYGVSLAWGSGYATQVSFSGNTATFTVPDGTNAAMNCDCPSVIASRNCNNELYDAQCTIAKSSFQLSTTISSISTDGKTIVLAATVPAGVNGVAWSLHGELTHTPSGEKRTVIGQLSDRKTLTIFTQLPNGAASPGDAVVINAGCDKSIGTCSGKFSNGVNFVGMPLLPPSNIFYVGLTRAIYRTS